MKGTTTRGIAEAVNAHTISIDALRDRIKILEEKVNSFAACMDVKFEESLGPDPHNFVWRWDAKRMVDKDEGPKF